MKLIGNLSTASLNIILASITGVLALCIGTQLMWVHEHTVFNSDVSERLFLVAIIGSVIGIVLAFWGVRSSTKDVTICSPPLPVQAYALLPLNVFWLTLVGVSTTATLLILAGGYAIVFFRLHLKGKRDASVAAFNENTWNCILILGAVCFFVALGGGHFHIAIEVVLFRNVGLVLLSVSLAYKYFASPKRENKSCYGVLLFFLILEIFIMLLFHATFSTHAISGMIIAFTSAMYAFNELCSRQASKTSMLKCILSKDYMVIPLFVGFYLGGYYYFGGYNTFNAKSVLGDTIGMPLLGGWDQSAYYRMTKNIASGAWFPNGYGSGYFYGLGYPILAVPFFNIIKSNPYLLPNLILYVGVLYAVYKTLLRWVEVPIAFIAVVLLGLQSVLLNWSVPYMRLTVMPWNNSVSLFVSAIFIYVLFTRCLLKPVHLLSLGLLYGWVFASRYGDVIFFFPLVLYFVIHDKSFAINNIIRRGLFFTSGVLLIALPVLYSHKLFYGHYLDTYLKFATSRGTFFPALGDLRIQFFKFVEVFLFPWTGGEVRIGVEGLLASMGYVTFIVYGIYELIKHKWYAETFVSLLFVIANIIYFTATGSVSARHIKYDGLRYFSPIIPVLVFYSFYGISSFVAKSQSHVFRPVLALFLVLTVFLAGAHAINSQKTLQGMRKGLANSEVEVVATFNNSNTDAVTKNKHPNYGKDGSYDYVFSVEFKSRFPLMLYRSTRIVFLDKKDLVWTNGRKNQNRWGIGIINDVKKNVMYTKHGDQFFYNNYYLSASKKISMIIPVPEPLSGRFRFVINTSHGTFERVVNVKVP